jgi:two-component system, OmpR family, copper resistance phosphate regulon response regulator CusR
LIEAMMKNILLIEDEASVAGFLKKGLEELGFAVHVAADGAQGLALALEETYDAIVLDVILPKINGWDLCRKLRREHKLLTPILMLTALSATDQVVKGLEEGADDYMVKPFKLDELVARLYAIQRRYHQQVVERNVLAYGGLEIDLDTCEVTRNGDKIKLTAREFRLLEYFMKNQGKVLSRMRILQNVWGVDFDPSTNVVDVYINYLRKKIDKNYEPKLLHTVINMGYILKSDEA